MSTERAPAALVIPAMALLDHRQGHRRLTRHVIDVFPEDQGYVCLRALGIDPPPFYER